MFYGGPGGGEGRPTDGIERLRSSPDELQTHLDIAIVNGSGNAAELRCSESSIRDLKLRRVHHVEKLRAELQHPARFGVDGEIFKRSEVEIHLARAVARVSSGIPECEAHGQSVSRGVDQRWTERCEAGSSGLIPVASGRMFDEPVLN